MPPSDEGGGSRQRDGGRESRSPTNQNRKPGSIRYELPNLFFEGFCGGVGEFFAPRGQKRGDVRERPLCGMQRALRMCPVLGCAETASLPVANIAASQNASKSRFAMRDAKTATGRGGDFCQKEPPLPQKGAFAKVPSSCSRFLLTNQNSRTVLGAFLEERRWLLSCINIHFRAFS